MVADLDTKNGLQVWFVGHNKSLKAGVGICFLCFVGEVELAEFF
jgi:hypothetical protein